MTLWEKTKEINKLMYFRSTMFLLLGMIACSLIADVTTASFDDGDAEPGKASTLDLSLRRRNVNQSTFGGKKWPNGVVPYSLGPNMSEKLKTHILAAMREIESNTKHGDSYCVRFIPKTDHHHDYVDIQSSGPGLYICDSSHGMQENTWMKVDPICGIFRIIRLLLRILGFYYEQQRPDRDAYIDVHDEYVNPLEKDHFIKLDTTEMDTLNTTYDLSSIMQPDSFFYGYLFKNYFATMTAKPGSGRNTLFGPNLYMSTNDVLRVQRYYQCTEDTSHIQTAKPTCGFDDDLPFCGLVQQCDDDFDWQLRTRNTPTMYTGPDGDTTETGSYAYVEANGHFNETAKLKSAELPAGRYCIRFSYFFYGGDGGTFKLRNSNNPDTEIFSNKFIKDFRWNDFRQDYNAPTAWSLILQYTVGTGESSDFAIDDFAIDDGECDRRWGF